MLCFGSHFYNTKITRHKIRAMSLQERRLRDQYEQLLRPKRSNEKPRVRYEKLRRLVVLKGIPAESTHESSTHLTHCSLRGRVWKMLLGVQVVNAQEYLYQVQRRTSTEMSIKIEKDIERTLKNNVVYHHRVSDNQLRRVLNAYVNSTEKEEQLPTDPRKRRRNNTEANASVSSGPTVHSGLYVQGMNVLAAPFLYVMNELDGYACFGRLLNHHCPQYITKDLHGAQQAARLLQEIVMFIDPELDTHMTTTYHGDWGSVTSLPTLLSFSADKPCERLDELLKLWDVLFALGVHMNVLFVAAHMMTLRDLLLNGDHGLLQATLCVHKDLPPLDANLLISLALHIVGKLPEDLYCRLECHPYRK